MAIVDATAGISLRRLIVAYSHSRTSFAFCRDTIDHNRLPIVDAAVGISLRQFNVAYLHSSWPLLLAIVSPVSSLQGDSPPEKCLSHFGAKGCLNFLKIIWKARRCFLAFLQIFWNIWGTSGKLVPIIYKPEDICYKFITLNVSFCDEWKMTEGYP